MSVAEQQHDSCGRRYWLFIAPIGKGPAATAVRIIGELPESAEVLVVGDQEIADFVVRSCRRAVRIPSELRLKADTGDRLICVDHLPAARKLIDEGYGNNVIIVDSILPWRLWLNQEPLEDGAAAYFALRSLPYSVKDMQESVAASGTQPRSFHVIDSEAAPEEKVYEKSVDCLVYYSGYRKALTGEVRSVMSHILTDLTQGDDRMVIVGGDAVPPLSSSGTGADSGPVLYTAAAPGEFRDLQRASRLFVATPGFSSISSALASGCRVYLLPPLNSTQIHHYFHFMKRRFHGLLTGKEIRYFYEQAPRVPWTRHATIMTRFLSDNRERLRSRLARYMGSERDARTATGIMSDPVNRGSVFRS